MRWLPDQKGHEMNLPGNVSEAAVERLKNQFLEITDKKKEREIQGASLIREFIIARLKQSAPSQLNINDFFDVYKLSVNIKTSTRIDILKQSGVPEKDIAILDRKMHDFEDKYDVQQLTRVGTSGIRVLGMIKKQPNVQPILLKIREFIDYLLEQGDPLSISDTSMSQIRERFKENFLGSKATPFPNTTTPDSGQNIWVDR